MSSRRAFLDGMRAVTSHEDAAWNASVDDTEPPSAARSREADIFTTPSRKYPTVSNTTDSPLTVMSACTQRSPEFSINPPLAMGNSGAVSCYGDGVLATPSYDRPDSRSKTYDPVQDDAKSLHSTLCGLARTIEELDTRNRAVGEGDFLLMNTGCASYCSTHLDHGEAGGRTATSSPLQTTQLSSRQHADIVPVHRHETSRTDSQNDLPREAIISAEAETVNHRLRQEVATLRSENAMLKAAAGRVGATVDGSSVYVEELEFRIAHLSRLNEEMRCEMAAKDDRIRLLERKFIDHLLGNELTPVGSGDNSSSPLTLSAGHPTLKLVPSPAQHEAATGTANLRSRPPSSLQHAALENGTINSERKTTMSPTVRGSSPMKARVSSQCGSVAASARRSSTVGRLPIPIAVPLSGGRPMSARREVRPSSPQKQSLGESANSCDSAAGRRASLRQPPMKPQGRRLSTFTSQPSTPKVATQRHGSTASLTSRVSMKTTPTDGLATGHPHRVPATPRSSSPRSSVLNQSTSVRSMMAYKGTSPARSVTPSMRSMRSATSTRSRPTISYSTKGDITTMQGTTTTVTFRTKSATRRDPLVPAPQAEHMIYVPDPQPFISDKFETTYHPNRLVRSASASQANSGNVSQREKTVGPTDDDDPRSS